MSTICRRETGFFLGDNAIFDRRDVSVQEKIVYLYFCCSAYSESRAWPSLSQIARACSMSQNMAKRTVANLIEKGLLEREDG